MTHIARAGYPAGPGRSWGNGGSETRSGKNNQLRLDLPVLPQKKYLEMMVDIVCGSLYAGFVLTRTLQLVLNLLEVVAFAISATGEPPALVALPAVGD
jgi:hypothetical protein